jgi:hypothetical protein
MGCILINENTKDYLLGLSGDNTLQKAKLAIRLAGVNLQSGRVNHASEI